MSTLDHSSLPPSGASAWSECPMWVTMNRQFPQDDTEDTLLGTVAHWVCWESLKRTVRVGEISPYRFIPVTEEMIDGARVFWEAVAVRVKHERLAECVIESKVAIPIHPECFGTPDLWHFNSQTYVLHVFDYKFGHRFVEEWWNKQTLLYVLGIIESLSPRLLGSVDNITVVVTIVQPRCYYKGEPVRSHRYRITEASDLITELTSRAHLALSAQPSAVAGLHCDTCPGRHACPTLQKAAYYGAEFASQSLPLTIDSNAAALELRMLERAQTMLDARIEGLREQTRRNILSGATVPFYHLKTTRPHRRWNVSNEEVRNLGKLAGVEVSKDDVITPTQARKAGMDQAFIDAFTTVPAGSPKLVADNPTDIAKVFTSQEK